MIEEKLKNWKKELKKISLDTTFRGDSSSIFVKGPYIVGYDEFCDLSFRISNSTDGFNFFIERSGSTIINSNVYKEKIDKVYIVYKNILKDIIDFERSIFYFGHFRYPSEAPHSNTLEVQCRRASLQLLGALAWAAKARACLPSGENLSGFSSAMTLSSSG